MAGAETVDKRLDEKITEIEKKEQEPPKPQPLFNITLYKSFDPNAPISIAKFNEFMIKNFTELHGALTTIVNNQKMLASVIDANNQKIEEVTKKNLEISKLVMDILGKDEKKD